MFLCPFTKGNNNYAYSLLSLVEFFPKSLGFTLKGKNLLLMEQILSLKSSPMVNGGKKRTEQGSSERETREK